MQSPVATGVVLPHDILSHYASIARLPFPFILDDERWTYMGSDPFRVLVASGNRITDWQDGEAREITGDPFAILEEALAGHSIANTTDVPFAGGAVGYLGYDLGSHLENLPHAATDDRGFPDMVISFHDRVIAIDRTTGTSKTIELAGRAAKRAISSADYTARYGTLPPVEPWNHDRPVVSNFTRERYLESVAKIREHIFAGDCYQVNLSQRFHTRLPMAPFDIYTRLRSASPAPYSALLEVGSRSVISSSPELFLRKDGRGVVTKPIKGTRPRGAGESEDRRMQAELLSNPKEDAELAMIVDLERNDLGRVCEFGSVRVTEPKRLETHPTLHHLVATLEGRLRGDVGPVGLLRATFPGGSITGAPKIRAMQIIDALEPTRRAAYTGAIGWIGFDGRMGMSVAIRIIERHGDRLWFQVGGGIVADSDPEREFHETLVKAAGIVRALGLDLPA